MLADVDGKIKFLGVVPAEKDELDGAASTKPVPEVFDALKVNVPLSCPVSPEITSIITFCTMTNIPKSNLTITPMPDVAPFQLVAVSLSNVLVISLHPERQPPVPHTVCIEAEPPQ